jgi:hypothetical protein
MPQFRVVSNQKRAGTKAVPPKKPGEKTTHVSTVIHTVQFAEVVEPGQTVGTVVLTNVPGLDGYEVGKLYDFAFPTPTPVAPAPTPPADDAEDDGGE